MAPYRLIDPKYNAHTARPKVANANGIIKGLANIALLMKGFAAAKSRLKQNTRTHNENSDQLRISKNKVIFSLVVSPSPSIT